MTTLPTRGICFVMLRAATLGAVLAPGLAAQQAPVLDHLFETVLTRSGHINIHGTHLDQAGQVFLDDVECLVIPIPGTNAVEMHAYVPEDMPFGPSQLTVTSANGSSNPLPVTVAPRTPDGRALWVFTMNSQNILRRPALGADGTVYAKSGAGEVVALTPQGALDWHTNVGADWQPEIDVGLDGTIYTADGWPTVYALDPADGSVEWTWQDSLTNGLISGPNVGPDGNIYAVSHAPASGIFSLDPQGNFRWKGPDNPYSPIGGQGQEIVFSDTQLFFCQNGYFDSFDFDGDRIFRNTVVTQYDDSSPQPAVGPNGDSYVEWWAQLQSYAPGGSLNWMIFGPGGNNLRDPDVGADGSIYTMRNVFNTFHAVNPDGSEKWTYNHPDTLINPVVDPAGETIVIGGAGDGFDPGFFLAIDAATGTPMWEVELPFLYPNPWDVVKVSPQGRARFTPDGSVAYAMAIGPSGSPGHGFIYALQVAPIVDVGHALAGSAGEPTLTGTGTLQVSAPITLELADGAPSANAWLIVGGAAAGTPFKQGVMLPSVDIVVPLQTDGSGSLQIGGSWPAGFPSDTATYMQVWIDDAAAPAGLAASNALSLITP